MATSTKTGSERVIELLESIDNSMKQILKRSAAKQAPRVADDHDLNGKYGDPKVNFNPRDYTGPSMKGRPMSECPAEFLDLYAEAKEFFGRKADEEGKTTNKGKPSAPYEFADAARARGWAKRIRDGKHRPKASAAAEPQTTPGWGSDTAETPTDGDIPW